jgi:hypothetical protein
MTAGMKVLKIVLAAIIIAGCSKDDPELTRSFNMGFTPFPYAVSQEAVDFTYQKIAQDADMVNHHFDNGVPWVEALNDEPFHTNITNDWTHRKNSTPPGQKVYISVAPLNIDRNGLGKYRGEAEDMPLPAPWDSYHFSSIEVKTAYVNYCKRIIEFFKPDFFNMAIEANLLYYVNPSLWSEFLDFHEYVYQQLKASYPDLVVFSSVTGAHMLEKFFEGNDHVQQRLAVRQILENSDLYALSFYPYLSNYLGNPFPENTFEELFNISDKPLAIAETGYAAQSFTINTGTGEVTVTSDPVKQHQYLEELLSAAEKHHARFVINFVLRDYDQLWQSIGAKNDLTIAWRDTGLYDEDGNTREAYTTWKGFLSRSLEMN